MDFDTNEGTPDAGALRRAVASLPVDQLCGQLIVGGFGSSELPPNFEAALARGHRAGAILFRRNLPSAAAAHALCQRIASASEIAPPIISLDQEGGRVSRLGAPLLELPPMRVLGETRDWALVEAAAHLLGMQLRLLGFTLDFAPVLDVDSNPNNPVIGDRAFDRSPKFVARGAKSFARGLLRAGIGACGKHFPGHGDTALDSHFELPFVSHDEDRLRDVELSPFAELTADLPALMSAHVVFRALDPERPATLSARIVGDLLRNELGFEGVLFSDDMEMGALAARGPVEFTAVDAVRAGCDVLLLCHSWELQERVLAQLVRTAEQDVGFHARCREAALRCLLLRYRFPPRASAHADDVETPLFSADGERTRRQLAALTHACLAD